MTRRLIGKKAMTPAQKQKRYREGLKPNSARSKHRRRVEPERELATRTRAANAALGATQLYNVIYADPPWQISTWSRETGLNRSADNHYPTMPLDEIKALQVPAALDCVLYLWATVPMLPHALEVVTAWGFTYKSHFVWLKTERTDNNKLRLGTGYWSRNCPELLIVATRGDIPAPAPGGQGPSAFFAPVGAHSVKPEAVAVEIERLYPTCPKMEMFYRDPDGSEAERVRREKREAAGWYFWGNEAPGPAEIAA